MFVIKKLIFDVFTYVMYFFGIKSQMTDTTEMTVTPWIVEGVVDYDKLTSNFGCTRIDGELIKRIEQVTRCRAHRWLERGLFFSQRDLEQLLASHEKEKPIYIYTGRGPSNDMHLGHCVPFEFTKYLQDAFGAVLVIQLSDDEKYYFRKANNPPEYYRSLARENAKDIIAFGFNPDKTYIFANSEEITKNVELLRNFVLMAGNSSGADIEAIFGLSTSNAGGTKQSNTVGQVMWPVLQSLPAYSSSFTKFFGTEKKQRLCLVPMAIDQDPYFRLARDFAHKFRNLGYMKPSCIHSEFLPALAGSDGKMSSTGVSPTVFLVDSVTEIKKKIKSYAFSGGGDTLELHRKHGANLAVDISYQYLLYFLEDDAELEHIAKEYSSGRMLTSDVKRRMTECVISYIQKLQDARSKVTDDVIDHFFSDTKAFDHSLPEREPIALRTDEEYAKMGSGFDRYFGCLKV